MRAHSFFDLLACAALLLFGCAVDVTANTASDPELLSVSEKPVQRHDHTRYIHISDTSFAAAVGAGGFIEAKAIRKGGPSPASAPTAGGAGEATPGAFLEGQAEHATPPVDGGALTQASAPGAFIQTQPSPAKSEPAMTGSPGRPASPPPPGPQPPDSCVGLGAITLCCDVQEQLRALGSYLDVELKKTADLPEYTVSPLTKCVNPTHPDIVALNQRIQTTTSAQAETPTAPGSCADFVYQGKFRKSYQRVHSSERGTSFCCDVHEQLGELITLLDKEVTKSANHPAYTVFPKILCVDPTHREIVREKGPQTPCDALYFHGEDGPHGVYTSTVELDGQGMYCCNIQPSPVDEGMVTDVLGLMTTQLTPIRNRHDYVGASFEDGRIECFNKNTQLISGHVQLDRTYRSGPEAEDLSTTKVLNLEVLHPPASPPCDALYFHGEDGPHGVYPSTVELGGRGTYCCNMNSRLPTLYIPQPGPINGYLNRIEVGPLFVETHGHDFGEIHCFNKNRYLIGDHVTLIKPEQPARAVTPVPSMTPAGAPCSKAQFEVEAGGRTYCCEHGQDLYAIEKDDVDNFKGAIRLDIETKGTLDRRGRLIWYSEATELVLRHTSNRAIGRMDCVDPTNPATAAMKPLSQKDPCVGFTYKGAPYALSISAPLRRTYCCGEIAEKESIDQAIVNGLIAYLSMPHMKAQREFTKKPYSCVDPTNHYIQTQNRLFNVSLKSLPILDRPLPPPNYDAALAKAAPRV